LLVFAAFFHVYRYAMSQQKNAPPPPPVLVQEEIPKLVESDVPKSSEISEDDSTKEKSEPKQEHEIKFRVSIIEQHKEIESQIIFAKYSI